MRARCCFLALFLVLPLLGCGHRQPADQGATPPAAGEKKLTLWSIWNTEPRQSALAEIVKSFEAANPGVKIEVSTYEPDQYKTSIRVALGSQQPPDIYFVWSGEKMLKSFIRGGNVLDITKYLDADSAAWRNRIPAASLAPYAVGDKVYGVPYLLQCTFFFYNKAIFNKYSIAIPKTWDELTAACEKLKAAGVTPIALGNAERWPAHHYPNVLAQRLIGKAATEAQFDPTGPGDYADPAWVKALDMFKAFADKGYFNPSPNSVARNNARVLFYSGKTAMFYTGTWDFARLGQGSEAPKEFWDNWDFFNFPTVAGGKGEQDALAGSPDGYVISAKTQHPDEAAKFLAYMDTVDVAKQFVAKCHELVQVKGAVTKENSNAALQKYAEMVANAKTICPWMDTMMEGSVADAYMNGVQGLLAGQQTPEQVMEAVRARQAEVKKGL
jgi:raffinose/stachyose/melibiose transport system substrate-binding protein